jgi:hypothetical protein
MVVAEGSIVMYQPSRLRRDASQLGWIFAAPT